MFRWFNKKKQPSQEETSLHFFEKMFKPRAVATALAEVISAYVKDVEDGKLAAPAHARFVRDQDNASVLEIWRDTRLEALKHLWIHGASNGVLLAYPKRQKEILDYHFENKPHLEYPHQPTDDPIHDTLQAVFQVYLYLHEAGWAEEGEDIHAKNFIINALTKEKPIFNEFKRNIEQLYVQWSEYDGTIPSSGNRPPVPRTIFDILYEDVTKKSKKVALKAVFGYDHVARIEKMEQRVRILYREQGKSEEYIDERMKNIQKTTQILLSAQDPDHVI